VTQEALTAFYMRLKGYEGVVGHLYRDSAVAGNATCAVGHLVPSYTACQTLPFDPPITQAEWDALQSMPAGRIAEFYASVTEGRLSDQEMDGLLQSDVGAVLEALRGEFPGFDGFPDGPAAALADMGFNLSVLRLVRFFPTLTAAARQQDWQTCAAECHRIGVSEDRNSTTAALFLA